MIDLGWWHVAVVCNIAAYIFYGLGIRRQLVRPNRSSWLIWSTATAIEALTYNAVNEGAAANIIFLISAFCCIAITIAVWRQSAWQRPSATESLCMAVSLAAMIVWFGFQDAYWAHMMIIAAIPVSFVPTWKSVLEDRRREQSPAWGLWTIGDLATLFVIVGTLHDQRTELPYIMVELLCHASMWFMIGLISINPLRSFGFRRGGFYVREDYLGDPKIFSIGENHLGKAVFAATHFPFGTRIVEFTGERVHKSLLPRSVEGVTDRFVQIDEDYWMGPSGGVDDLINHSCNPNAGLRFLDGGVFLHALRDIEPGEEITWDYSTTLHASQWRMQCKCGAPNCRSAVGDFEELPQGLRDEYRAMGLVPPYLR